MNQKYWTLVLLGLFWAITGKANHISSGNPVEPLPKVSLKQLSSLEDLKVSGIEIFDTPPTPPKMMNGFHFPSVDAGLAAKFDVNSENYLPPPPPEEDKMADLLEDIGNGGHSEKIKKAREVIDKAIEIGNFIEKLSGDDLVSFPVVLKQELGNLTAHVVFNSMTLKPGGATIEVFVGMDIPQKATDSNGNKKDITLMFGGEVNFSSNGGIVGANTLGLLTDIAFQLGGSNKKTAIVLTAWEEGSQNADIGTFITIGCGGVEEFGIDAYVHFSREWLLPTDEFGSVLTTPTVPNAVKPRVQGHVAVIVQDWNNFLVQNLTINHFVLTKFPDVSFHIGNANLDLSDYRNPATVVFPSVYTTPDANGETLLPPNKNLWRGVYIASLELTLPEPFKRKCGGFGNNDIPLDGRSPDDPIMKELLATDNSLNPYAWDSGFSENNHGPNADGFINMWGKANEDLFKTTTETCRIKVSAKDLLIDKNGVSGEFSIQGEAPLIAGGQMNKSWGWSLNGITFTVITSNLHTFGFNGEIAIPIADKKTPLLYDAYFNIPEDKYVFTVENVDKMEFPLWNAAQVTLTNTQLIVEVDNGEFKPSVILNGDFVIGKPEDYVTDSTGSVVNMPRVDFEGIWLGTEAPYLDLVGDNAGITLQGGGSKVMNFPVQIPLLALRKDGNMKCYLDLELALNLMGEADGGLAASGNFKIYAKLEHDINGAHRWAFDRFEFGGASILIDLPSIKACGTLTIFEDDPIYGKGFSAKLDAAILGESSGTYTCGMEIPGAFNLSLAAIFGSKDGYRFFMLDGYVSSDNISIPLPPTPLFIKGFGGGVFYHMRPSGYIEPGSSGSPTANQGSDTSGIIYTPTPNTTLGLKFAVGLTTADQSMDGKLTCIVRFGNNLSLQNITFWGVAEFVSPVVELGAPPIEFEDRMVNLGKKEDDMHAEDLEEAKQVEDKIGAKLGLSLDFEGGFAFHGFAEVFMSAAQGAVQGSGSLDLLIDPAENEWHIYIGGYYDGNVKVPQFFNPEGDKISLYPVHVGIQYSPQISVSADAYFLLGNKIPGPPPLHPLAAEYFEEEPEQNRELLNCTGTPATGAGVAFGAAMQVEFKHKTRIKLGFIKITILDVDVAGALGFDIALLKYGPETSCSIAEGYDEHGLNGFRATGNIWAFVSAKGKVLVFPLPEIGVGVKLQADIVNPSYFDATVVINFVRRFKFGLEIGEECGHPCSVVQP